MLNNNISCWSVLLKIENMLSFQYWDFKDFEVKAIALVEISFLCNITVQCDKHSVQCKEKLEQNEQAMSQGSSDDVLQGEHCNLSL